MMQMVEETSARPKRPAWTGDAVHYSVHFCGHWQSQAAFEAALHTVDDFLSWGSKSPQAGSSVGNQSQETALTGGGNESQGPALAGAKPPWNLFNQGAQRALECAAET